MNPEATGLAAEASTGYARGMALKSKILGWLRSTPAKDDELEDAEADELTREYSAGRADTIAGFELGGGRGDFERDQEAPRR